MREDEQGGFGGEKKTLSLFSTTSKRAEQKRAKSEEEGERETLLLRRKTSDLAPRPFPPSQLPQFTRSRFLFFPSITKIAGGPGGAAYLMPAGACFCFEFLSFFRSMNVIIGFSPLVSPASAPPFYPFRASCRVVLRL